MEHVAVFGIFVNLILGIWVTIYAYQIYKSYTYSFLQPLVHYTFFYNLGIFSLLITVYLNINLPENYMQMRYPFFRDTSFLLITLFEIGMVTSMLRIYLGFKGKDISNQYKSWILIGVIILVLSYPVRIVLLNPGPFRRLLRVIQAEIYDNFIVLEIPILVAILVLGRKNIDRGIKNIGRTFAIFYLSRDLFPLILTALFFANIIRPVSQMGIPLPIRFFIVFVILVYFSLIPFLWIKYSFLKYADSMLKIIEDRAVLDTVYEKYNISKREQDILRLILDGKSNKEIEDTLFISYHTVKNHIYNLYQKLRVNNRHQLLHFITKFQKNKQ